MKRYSYVSEEMPDTGNWKARHRSALYSRHPIAMALRAWTDYAEDHGRRLASQIGSDYILGPAWARWGLAIKTLLDGDIGMLDAGTINHIILDNLNEQGFDPDLI